MNVRVGEEFTISLDANPTTGYTWGADYDRSFIELKEEAFDPPSSMRIGGSGVQRFTFMPIKPGNTSITLAYKRPWEASPIDVKAFSIDIS